MNIRQILRDALPNEQLAARCAGLAFTAMFCAGLVLRKSWLSQTIDWALLLPCGIWLLALTWRSVALEARRRPFFWMIVVGLACYLAALLLSTAVAGSQGRFLKHLSSAVLCIFSVAVLAPTHRYDPRFARYFGVSIAVAVAIAALILIGASIANGGLGKDRLEGVPAFNWVLNANAVGGVYAICFAVVLGHGLRRDISWPERSVTFVIALLPLAIVLLTKSRGSLLGCLAAILVTFLVLPRRVSLAICGAMAVTAAILAVAFPVWLHLVLGRGDSLRLEIWQHFLELSGERIWLGYGLDVDVFFELGGKPIYTPHNILLACLVRGGALGLISLSIALMGAVGAAVMALRRGWSMPLIVLGASLALSTVDHEVVPSNFSFYWYLFWLPFGLAAAAALRPEDDDVAASIGAIE